MPTVFWDGPYRLYFHKGEVGVEPPHVHVRRERHIAKFWLEPVRLVRAGRFPPVELRRIERIIEHNHDRLMEAWHGM